MKKLLLVFISLLFTIGLMACGDTSTSSKSTNTKNIDNTINVSMDAQPVINNGKVKFDITTNLPNETELMISLKNETNNYFAQDKTSVSNGKAKTSEFSNQNKSLKTGTYQLEVSTPISNVQPASVKSKIGDKGSNLTGSYVVDDPTLGKTIEYTKTITIK